MKSVQWVRIDDCKKNLINTFLHLLNHILIHNNLLLYRKQHLESKIYLILLYPKSKCFFIFISECILKSNKEVIIAYKLTFLSSTITSLVIKSAPTVALYCYVNFCLTYLLILVKSYNKIICILLIHQGSLSDSIKNIK